MCHNSPDDFNKFEMRDFLLSNKYALIRFPMGFFRTLPADGEGALRPPPPPIFYLKFADDVTGQVKCKIFYYLTSLASPDKTAVPNWNKASETTWIVSRTLINTLIVSTQIVNQGHEAKKIKLKIWGLSGLKHILGSIQELVFFVGTYEVC